ncbi:protein kinase [Nonomuraea pusilla]|uniref:serine/threonine protein kinase n=1 Tax=Nonomuraea pusilla TaxID=46177 RepID=UPI00332A0F54
MIGGRYRLIRTIGQGGMGTVWQAHDEVLGRDVAVKEVLPPPDLSGPERDGFALRTLREARAAGRVAHPGVAAVYDVLEERGHPWIVMQLVPSRTLGELIREEGPLPPRQVAAIGLQLLEALRAAHAAGVLHRDVKPDNVLLADDGRAVLTDFGIATTEDEAPVTRTGVLVGTPAFMAPERAAGGRAAPASDLWSLGVTLYTAVEGHSPFHRDNALATLGAVLHAEPDPLCRAGMLAPVLLGLLRKNPAERMSLEEAEGRLAAILDGDVVEPTGPVPVAAFASPQERDGPAPEPARPARRRLPLAAAAGGTLLVAVVTGGAAWWSSRPPDAARLTPSSVPTTVVVTSTPSATPTPSATRGRTPAGEGDRRDTAPPVRELAPGPGRHGDPTPTRTRASRGPSRSADPTPTRSRQRDDVRSQGPGEVEPSGGEQDGEGERGDGRDEAPGDAKDAKDAVKPGKAGESGRNR